MVLQREALALESPVSANYAALDPLQRIEVVHVEGDEDDLAEEETDCDELVSDGGPVICLRVVVLYGDEQKHGGDEDVGTGSRHYESEVRDEIDSSTLSHDPSDAVVEFREGHEPEWCEGQDQISKVNLIVLRLLALQIVQLDEGYRVGGKDSEHFDDLESQRDEHKGRTAFFLRAAEPRVQTYPFVF